MLTLNEEPNIRRCLASVAWADQVVVVDSGSADRTVPLARVAGRRGGGAAVAGVLRATRVARSGCRCSGTTGCTSWTRTSGCPRSSPPRSPRGSPTRTAPGSRTGCALCSWAPGSAIAAGTPVAPAALAVHPSASATCIKAKAPLPPPPPLAPDRHHPTQPVTPTGSPNTLLINSASRVGVGGPPQSRWGGRGGRPLSGRRWAR